MYSVLPFIRVQSVLEEEGDISEFHQTLYLLLTFERERIRRLLTI